MLESLRAQVYPVARGSSVLFVALFSRVVDPRADRMSPLGLAGIAVAIFGIGWTAAARPPPPSDPKPDVELDVRNVLADVRNVADAPDVPDAAAPPPPDAPEAPAPPSRWKALGFALVVGMLTAGYSLDDSVGVSVVDPLLYQLSNCVTMSCLTLPYMFAAHDRRKALRRAARERKKYVVGIGVGGAGTYLIVLYAFRMAKKAPYIVALRQVSIVFAALLGRAVLDEELTRPKMTAIALITFGVAVVSYADG